MNGYHHYSNMSHSKLPVSNGTVKEESLERPFQFETMMKELNEKQFECIAVIDPATGKIDGEKPEPHFQSPQCPADAERVRAMHAC
jgi:hypothetical protein